MAFKRSINQELNTPRTPKNIQLMKLNIKKFVYYVIQSYPTILTAQDRQNFEKFINHLPNVLLTSKMKNDFMQKLNNNPLNINNLKTQRTLSLWYKKVYN